MKKIFLLLLGLAVLTTGGFAQRKEPLRVGNVVVLEQGNVARTVVLSDADARVFIEFPVGVVGIHKAAKTRFSGTVLSPARTSAPAKAPKLRMKELYSFELLSDSGEGLSFSDEISVLNERNRLRLSILEPEKMESGNRPLVLFVIDDPFVRDPNLWRFVSDEAGWEEIGGKTTERNGKQIFSAKISATGIYTIFDHSPLSSDSADDYAIPETLDSLERKIDRLMNQYDQMMAEQMVAENPDYLPPFISDGSEDDFIEISEYEEEEEVIIPSLPVPAVSELNPIRVIPPTQSAEATVGRFAPTTETNFVSRTNSEESFVSKEGELPTAGSNNNSSNFMLLVLFGVIVVVGASVYLGMKRPY